MEDIQGLALCESFFRDFGEPIIAKRFPALRYTAGLLGYGSDVLGYDDAVSRDHMWGPRFYVFLAEADAGLSGDIYEALSRELPYTYRGYSVNFTVPDEHDNGVRHAEFISEGFVSPLVFIYTIDGFTREYLGVGAAQELTELDWLGLTEHRLLAFTAGRLFRDELGLEAVRRRFAYYPDAVRRYLIASNWAMISEEQAFVLRCAQTGDDIGSRLIAARLCERLMWLVFLYRGRYAPYSKWFGTAFDRLPPPEGLRAAIAAALTVEDTAARCAAYADAQAILLALHKAVYPTEAVNALPTSRKTCDTISAIIADELAATLRGTALESAPLIGSLSQAPGLASVLDGIAYTERIRGLYKA